MFDMSRNRHVSGAISNLSPFGRCILSPNPVSLGVAKFGSGTLRSGYATVTAKSGKSVMASEFGNWSVTTSQWRNDLARNLGEASRGPEVRARF